MNISVCYLLRYYEIFIFYSIVFCKHIIYILLEKDGFFFLQLHYTRLCLYSFDSNYNNFKA